MRGIETQVRKIRRQIFAEVSRIGFESDDESLIHDIEAVSYTHLDVYKRQLIFSAFLR